MLRDRGNKKWSTSIMLPEHVALLREWQANNDVPKPIIDEQKSEEINFIIQNALNNKLKLEVQYYSNNSLKIIKGIIDKIDYLNKKISIESSYDGLLCIKFFDIIDATIEE